MICTSPAYALRKIFISRAQELRNWCGVNTAPPMDWDSVVTRGAQEAIALGELKYFAARDELDDSTGTVSIRWCAGWVDPISASEAVESLFGQISAGSSTFKPLGSPEREFNRCSTVLLGPPFVTLSFGAPPLCPPKPYFRICLGTHASGKYTCACTGLDSERDAEYMLLNDFTPGMVTFEEFSALFDDQDAPNTVKELRITSNLDPSDWYPGLAPMDYEFFKSKVDEVHYHHLFLGQYVYRRYKTSYGRSAMEKYELEYRTGEWKDKGHSKLHVGYANPIVVPMDSDSE